MDLPSIVVIGCQSGMRQLNSTSLLTHCDLVSREKLSG